MARVMVFIMLLKNYIGGMLEQTVTKLGGSREDLAVSSGRCIIPNLDLVLQDSISYLPNLTKLGIIKVLNKANTLIRYVLLL